MARLEVDGDDLVVHLSALEKVLSFGGNRRIPVSCIRGVSYEIHPWSIARQTPSFVPRHRFGILMPGLVMYGTHLTVAGTDLWAVVGGRPAVCVDFADGSPFSRLFVSVRNPAQTVASITARLSRP